jgi:hypothetical protein
MKNSADINTTSQSSEKREETTVMWLGIAIFFVLVILDWLCGWRI